MNQLIKTHNFSLTFEQMCNFAAIAKTQDADETLRQLIQLCLVILPGEKFQNASQVMEAMMLFGLQFPEYQVQAGLDRLQTEGRVQRSANTYTPACGSLEPHSRAAPRLRPGQHNRTRGYRSRL